MKTLLIVLAIVLLCGEAGAETFTVTTTADTNDGACNADCSLREAVAAANASLSPYPVIILPEGTYTLDRGPAGDDSAASGDLDIRHSLYLYGAGASKTVLEAGPAFGDRILDIDPLDNAGPLYVGIKDITFRKGRAPANAAGGAILIPLGNDKLNLSDCVFSDNATSGSGHGGAIAGGGTLEISNTTFSGNVAAGSVGGGAIANLGSGSLKLSRVTFEGNRSLTVGGAIYNGGVFKASNVTFSGNRADDSGGALINNGGSVSFSNVTATLNVADDDNNGSGDGGGVASAIPVSVGNSILAGNIDRGGQSPDCAGFIDSQDYNLIQVLSCSLAGETSHNLIGVDPRLGPLADNGGTTTTHLLLAGSPALGGGGTVCEPQDQRGLTREAPCDIGAVEVVCGDARTEGDETCDDGNSEDGDACRNDCTLNLAAGTTGGTAGETTGATAGEETGGTTSGTTDGTDGGSTGGSADGGHEDAVGDLDSGGCSLVRT